MITRPERNGWSPERLAEAREYFEELDSAAVIVVHDGKLLADWGNTHTRYRVHSMRKSFLSALYGPFVANGAIKVDERLSELGIDDNEPALTAAEKQATVGDILKSRSGVYHASLYFGSYPDRPARGSHPAGTHWWYNNWDFNVALTIFEKKTKRDFFQELTQRIAEPLQMQDFRINDGYYFVGPLSVHPAYPFRMSARDMARFGLLFLRGGEWKGKKIIPRDWVDLSTQSHSRAGQSAGYGYMWWTYEKGKQLPGAQPLDDRAYYASGGGVQRIFVFPALDLVIVHLANTDQPHRAVSGADIERLLGLILSAKLKQSDQRSPQVADSAIGKPSAVRRADASLLGAAGETIAGHRADLDHLFEQAVAGALSVGANPNARDDDGRTALMLVAQTDNLEALRDLLAAGANVNATDPEFGQTALFYAASASSESATALLVDAGADKDSETRLGQTALLRAARNCHIGVVKVLLTSGATPNVGDRFGRFPLTEAASCEDPQLVAALVSAGAEVNARGIDGRTALIAASKSGRTDNVKRLLAAGARVDEKDDSDRTALMWAAFENRVDIVREFLRVNAEIDATGKSGMTALMWSAIRGANEAGKALSAAGARIEATNRSGQTALTLAATFGQVPFVKMLLELGANREVRDIHGMTPLERAAAEGHLHVVRIMNPSASGTNAAH